MESRTAGSLVRARAPLRLGLGGGGTDVSPYSDQYGGLVLNVTIDKFAHATVVARDDGRVEFIAADNEKQWSGEACAALQPVDGLALHVGAYNRIVREFNQGRPLSVTVVTHSEAPPGSGLGSSSTMVVALVKAYCELMSLPLGEYDIAHLAYEIERIDLGMAGGKQDQYAAAFGGLNFMEFFGDRVIVNPLRIKSDVKAELESSLVLFYTGVSRESAKIIAEQSSHVVNRDGRALEALHQVKQEAVRMKEAILKADFGAFAESMRSGWESKKAMASSITNRGIDAIYDAALEAGALSGKVSGAGGGGFMMFFTDPTRRPDLMRALSRFHGQAFTCNFFEEGAHSWRVR